MISIGTICLVVYTHPHASKFLGRECVVTEHFPADECGQHLSVRFNDGFECPAADKCLLPIDYPNETVTKENNKILEVSK